MNAVTRLLLPLLVVSGMASSGCANMFLDGARTVKGFPTQYKARYQAPVCQLAATGQRIAGPPGMTFYLVVDDRGPQLLEMDGRGQGAAIHNSWRDAAADYYFVRVRRQGWLYAFPRDASQQPARYSYSGRGFSVVTRGGITMPVGQPTAVCPLVKL